MKLLILDTETTGLQNVESSKCIEMAAILFDVDEMSIISTVQFLIPNDTNDAEFVNNISPKLMKNTTPGSLDLNIKLFKMYWDDCDYVVAHNYSFDKHFVEKHKLFGEKDKTWICSMSDFTYPLQTSSRKLTHLLADHSIPVVNAHRALSDILFIVQLFNKLSSEEIKTHIQNVTRKLLTQKKYAAINDKKKEFQAQNEMFKIHGFKFDFSNKYWYKMISDDQVKDLPFAIKLLDCEKENRVTVGSFTETEPVDESRCNIEKSTPVKKKRRTSPRISKIK